MSAFLLPNPCLPTFLKISYNLGINILFKIPQGQHWSDCLFLSTCILKGKFNNLEHRIPEEQVLMLKRKDIRPLVSRG